MGTMLAVAVTAALVVFGGPVAETVFGSPAPGEGERGAAAAGGVEYVTPLWGPITRHFEPPPTPWGAGHRGIDIAAPRGSLVGAAASGTVAFAGPVGGRLFVSIDHPDGLRTTYSFLDAVLVRAGDPVAAGSAVARSGEGHGGEEPPHLHFGLRDGDVYLDPEEALRAGLRWNLWTLVRLAPEVA